MKKNVFLFFLVCLSFLIYSQPKKSDSGTRQSLFSLKFTPGVSIPVGRDVEIFGPGGKIDLSANFKLRRIPFLSLIADLDYNYITPKAPTSVSLASLAAGAGVNWEIVPKFIIGGHISGGYYFAFLNSSEHTTTYPSTVFGTNPLFSGGINFTYMLLPIFSLGLEASYRNFLGFYNDLVFSLGASYHFKPKVSELEKLLEIRPEPLAKLELSEVEFTRIFPVFFKYYDDHPIGKAVLLNNEEFTLNDIKVSIFIKQYMDNPKLCLAPEELAPGEGGEVELYVLFTDNVLGISESTKVSSQIVVEGTYEGKKFQNEYIETVRLFDRNAMTWEDDRRAAAFVTFKDPTVLKFAKNISGIIKGKASQALNSNLLMAMGIHESLSLYGISYVIDPSTPYQELYTQKRTVDYLQFPKQTLEYKAGDCDDLSILYTALLESIGIQTAFITTPGHIFMALALDMDREEAQKQFREPGDLIFVGDNAWLPVDITEIGGGFLKAWQTGAKLWRKHEPEGQAGFFPMSEAWALYEPVGFSAEADEIDFPSQEKIVSTYLGEVRKFITREISDKVANLKERIEGTGGDIKQRNRLGVLYARYGLYEEAESEFSKILKQQEYSPTLMNMGNISFLRGNIEEALEYYKRVDRIAPDNPKALLGMARMNHELENYGSARKMYSRLKEIDPGLAEKFDYLELKGEEASRAAETGQVKESVVWEEDIDSGQ